MAYAFSKINSLLSDQEQPAKADVFSDAQGASQTTQPASAPGGASAPVKTTTEGSITPAGGGSTAAGAQSSLASQSLPDQQTQSGRAALSANAGRTATPTAISGISDQLTQRSNELQDESNKYVQAQEANQDYGLKSSDIDSAIGGDQSAQTKVSGLLGRTTTNTPGTFAPTTKMSVSDVALVNSDPGLQQLLSRGQGPTYGAGESAFDVRALKRTQGFPQMISAINAQQAAAQQALSDAPTTAAKQVTDYGTTALTAAQKSARDYLTSQSQSIDTADAKSAADWNAKVAALQKQGLFVAEPDVQAAQAAEAKALDPRVAAFLGQAELPASVNAGQYLSFAPTASSSDFVTADQAAKFNAIMSLLGQGGTTRAAGNAPTGPGYTFDAAGYQNQLGQAATGLRSAQDVTDKSQIDAILAGAGSRATQDSQAWLGTNAEDAAKAAAVAAAKGIDPSLLPTYQEVASTNPYFGVDPTKYYSADQRKLGATDVLTSDEAARLNSLAQDAQTGQAYQAGNAPLTSQAKFDTAGWLAALTAQVKARQAQEQAAEPTVPVPGGKGSTASSAQKAATDIAGGALDPTGTTAAAIAAAKNAGGTVSDLGKGAVTAFKQAGGEVSQAGKALGGVASQTAKPFVAPPGEPSQVLNPSFNSSLAQNFGLGSSTPTTSLFPGIMGQIQQPASAAVQNIGNVLSGKKKLW